MAWWGWLLTGMVAGPVILIIAAHAPYWWEDLLDKVDEWRGE